MAFVADINEDLTGQTWTSHGWGLETDHDHVTFPSMLSWIDSTSPDPSLGGFVLFGAWGDGGPAARGLWRYKIYSGLQPGQAVGFHAHVSWQLDTGPGSVFIAMEGADGSNPVSFIPDDRQWDFWTIPSQFPNVRDNVLAGIADSNGQIKVKIGAIGYGGSCNLTVHFAGVIEAGHFTSARAYGYIMQHNGTPASPFLSQYIVNTLGEPVVDQNNLSIYAEPAA